MIYLHKLTIAFQSDLKNNITYKRIQTKEVENKIKSVYENGSNLKLEYEW